MRPWEHQKNLQKESSVISINDLYIIIDKQENIRNASLFALTYLLAGRICEIVRYNRKGINHPSIRKKDIFLATKNNRETLLVSIRNEKNKNKIRKEIPIPLDREENRQLLEPLFTYMSSIGLEDELYPFGYKNALKIIKKFGFNPHFLRHIRLTHLTTVYDFNEQELRMYAGWADGRPAKHYVDLKWGDLLKKL